MTGTLPGSDAHLHEPTYDVLPIGTDLTRHDEAERLDRIGCELEQTGGLALHHVKAPLGDHRHALSRRRRTELADREAPRILIDALTYVIFTAHCNFRP